MALSFKQSLVTLSITIRTGKRQSSVTTIRVAIAKNLGTIRLDRWYRFQNRERVITPMLEMLSDQLVTTVDAGLSSIQ